MGWLVTAGIVGLLTGAYQIWRLRRAERDALTVERQKEIIAGDKQADLDEREIEDRSKTARDTAGSDFSQLR